MKNFLIKALLLAALLLFVFRGGVRVLMVGWRLFVPLALAGGLYLLVRQILDQLRLKQATTSQSSESLGKESPQATEDEVIVICPHCHQEMGSCPKCTTK